MQTIVGFLSRPHGFNVLTTIGKLEKFKILKIYTHKFNPRSQDSNKHVRDDFELFVKKCEELLLSGWDTYYDQFSEKNYFIS